MAVIDWFQKIEKKEECTFMLFDIMEFYPSNSDDAATGTAVTEKEVDIILHSRESLLFAGENHG